MQYLDTSALIALGDKKDRNHATAVEYLRETVKGGLRFIIGKHCLTEFIDGLTKRFTKQLAIYELDKILDSKIVELEWETKDDWSKALEYFKRYQDQKIDLTDSLSFAMMERRGIKEVFTFDIDFKIHGFVMKPELI